MDGSRAARALLIRGMLVGLAAGVLAFAFAKLFGEPQVDKAIAFEDAHGAPTTPLVSRTMQASLGLLTATLVYCVAMGGVFALIFAAVQGRVGHARPRVTAAVLALVALIVFIVVPFTKYPSNPPAVGNEATIGYRTQIYFAMVGISIAAALAALRLGRGYARRVGAWNGTILAVGSYLAIVAFAELVMPSLDEIPKGFDPSVIWHFRVATLGVHAVIWTTFGLGFGALAERVLAAPRPAGARTVTA